MRVECTIDGKTLTLSLNSNKPLSLILREEIDIDSVNTNCKGQMCGLCVVLIDGKAELSCLVPAFEIRGKEITTFDYFSKTRNMKDIERAYELVGATPCKECYASHSLLFESLVDIKETRPEEIIKQMAAIRCSCLDPDDEVSIVLKAIDIRRKRHVRRT